MDSGKLKLRGFRLTPIALAVAAMGFAAAPAVFAANVSASASNSQQISGPGTVYQGNGEHDPVPVTVTTTVAGNAFKNASGNVATNVASGASNNQANSTVVADTNANGGVTASANSTQSISGGLTIATAPDVSAGSGSEAVKPLVTNSATVGGNAFHGANGIVSASVASGIANEQSNATAAAQVTGTEGPTTESAHTTQTIGADNSITTLNTNDQDTSTLGGNAFEGTSGVVNANLAAGDADQQANATAAVDSAEGNATTSSANISQVANHIASLTPVVNGEPGKDENSEAASSTQGGNAFEKAHGAIAVNQASGNGNQQANTLSVAAGAGVVNAGANVTQSMTSNDVSAVDAETATTPYGLTTTVGGNAFQNASGNIGDNVATGEANQQGNSTSLTSSEKQFSGSMGNAYVTQTQASESTDVGNGMGVPVATTAIGGNAFRDVHGNVGVNAATGVENQQGNSTSIMKQTNPSGGMPMAFVSQKQDPQTDEGENDLNLDPTATLGGHAFEDGSGNMQVNEAAGDNNQQGNATSIAAVHTYAPGSSAVGSDMGGVTQSMDNVANSGDSNPVNATVAGSVFKSASGNMNVNVAAGKSNQQGNATTILASDELASQVTGHSSSQATEVSGSLGAEQANATVSGNAFEGATGNVGLNVASGTDNMQSNTLTVVGPSVH